MVGLRAFRVLMHVECPLWLFLLMHLDIGRSLLRHCTRLNKYSWYLDVWQLVFLVQFGVSLLAVISSIEIKKYIIIILGIRL